MGLFDRLFGTKSKASSPPTDEAGDEVVPLEQTCYDIAYFLLPGYAHERLDKLIELHAQTPNVAGAFFYLMACNVRGIEPVRELAQRFHWHAGQFDDQHQYLALEYPVPTPVDMGNSDPIALMESGIKLVLAPYYSAVIYGPSVPASYYILGQAPIGGGTTLRCVEKAGANCNLGPGPAPSLPGFLEAIRPQKR